MKRLLLFFDQVILPAPTDRAVVNDGEIVERFPGLALHWSARSPYPRTEGYEELVQELLASLGPLLGGHLVRLAPDRADERMAVAHLRAQALGLAQPRLVAAAIPDYSPTQQVGDRWPQNCVISFTGSFAQSGHRSKYAIDDARPPVQLAGVEPDWSVLGQLRLGRTLKYLQIAHRARALPVGDDDSSAAIQVTVTGAGFKETLTPDDLANLAIGVDGVLVDPFERELESVSWSEVRDLRRAFLPVVSPLRDELHRIVTRIARSPDPSLSDYRRALGEAKAAQQELTDRQSQALASLGLAVATRVLPAGGFTVIGLPGEWTSLVGKLLAGGLAAGVALSGEIKDYYLTRKKARAHPLFVLGESVARLRRVVAKIPDPR